MRFIWPHDSTRAVCSASLSGQITFWLDLKMHKLWKPWLNQEPQNTELITPTFCMDVRNPKLRLPEVSRSSGESKSLWSMNYSQVHRVFRVSCCKARICLERPLLYLAGRHCAHQDWVTPSASEVRSLCCETENNLENSLIFISLWFWKFSKIKTHRGGKRKKKLKNQSILALLCNNLHRWHLQINIISTCKVTAPRHKAEEKHGPQPVSQNL